MNEISQKNIKSNLPKFPLNNDLSKDLSKLTLDNLKALREKAVRMWKASKTNPALKEYSKDYVNQFIVLDTELRRRMTYINGPIKETIRKSRPSYYNECPHCKKEIYEKHTYYENGKDYHSDCNGPIKFFKTPEEEKQIQEFLNKLKRKTKPLPKPHTPKQANDKDIPF